ncbi:hypothetical protein ISN45_At05g044840 [Arabidopsis thaliana x Arabidopsis arenosa]|uniref:Uncharacterized protein n=2 Tax=Arabidopsis TaxID=3701 RepID=A0A8T2DPK4_ARASU|nr:hypothetical protein ISN45_At05g044840 [Arabidopsis thaliana x Arabidopsis arenosa]KAG7612402.1 hypothetical protein ISN44_As05g044200 [Arabidopsis suecica]
MINLNQFLVYHSISVVILHWFYVIS